MQHNAEMQCQFLESSHLIYTTATNTFIYEIFIIAASFLLSHTQTAAASYIALNLFPPGAVVRKSS